MARDVGFWDLEEGMAVLAADVVSCGEDLGVDDG